MASHLRVFAGMNPTIFNVSRVEEEHQELIDELYNILYAIVVSSSEKAEISIQGCGSNMVCAMEG